MEGDSNSEISLSPKKMPPFFEEFIAGTGNLDLRSSLFARIVLQFKPGLRGRSSLIGGLGSEVIRSGDESESTRG